jgi:hypothetical protein
MTETIDAEVIEETGGEIAIREPAAPALFGTDDPGQIIEKAKKVAVVLNDVITQQKLYTTISGKRYVLVEGWTTLGALCNVFAKTEWTHPIENGWEAAVVVVNGQGVEIGRAEAQCLRSERNWKSRDDFALKSMAQTRAMGKALRMPLGWIAVLSGYESTPAEEMPAQAQDDVPFEPSPAADQGASGGASAGEGSPGFAVEAKVTELLELAARISDDAHDIAVGAIAAKRDGGALTARWLDAQIVKARAKLPAEEPAAGSQFEIPESARA